MNETRPPMGPGSAPLKGPPPPPPVSTNDDDEFAAFLEEEQTTPTTPAVVPAPAPSTAKPASAPAPAPPPAPAAPAKPIIHFGPEGQRKQHNWKRQPVINGTGACRVKSFRGKYSDQGLEHLDDAINEWLDAHPDVEIKFVTSTAESFEGKTREPALVLNLWY